MMSKSQLQLLSYLLGTADSELSVTSLADSLDWSHGHTSRTISELKKWGCIRTETRGRRKIVSLTAIEPIRQLEELTTAYSHVDFPELIAGAGLQILYYLDHRRTASAIAEHSTVSRATVYRRLDDLQQVGIVGKSRSRYQLNDQFTTLSSIARGLYHHRHRREAQRYTGKINVHWETHDEYLFTCGDDIESDGFYLTGPALFETFDIPLLTREQRQYIRSERISTVTSEALICHTLLVDDGPRYRIYCLLLIEKQAVEASALRETAAHYQPEAALDLRAVIDELLEYLETDGEAKTDQLPKWEAFKRTATEYDISL